MVKPYSLALVVLAAVAAIGTTGCHTHGPNWLLGPWILAVNADGSEPDASCARGITYNPTSVAYLNGGLPLWATYETEDGKVYSHEKSMVGATSNSMDDATTIVHEQDRKGTMQGTNTLKIAGFPDPPVCRYIRDK